MNFCGGKLHVRLSLEQSDGLDWNRQGGWAIHNIHKRFFGGSILNQIGDGIQNRGIRGCRHGLSNILGQGIILGVYYKCVKGIWEGWVLEFTWASCKQMDWA